MSHPIIALWSHPRSMSTAFERIMRSRGDVDCMHEPFMYDYYINRSKREMPHFDAMDDHPRSYEAIRGMILTKAESGPVFFKDMSYYVVPHILDDGAFLDRVTHSFLIRDPKASILSYAKLDPDMLLEEIGLEAQWRHAEAVRTRTGRPPMIVRSEAVQSDPEGRCGNIGGRSAWPTSRTRSIGMTRPPRTGSRSRPGTGTSWKARQSGLQTRRRQRARKRSSTGSLRKTRVSAAISHTTCPSMSSCSNSHCKPALHPSPVDHILLVGAG
jgi:hypothetical protein